MQLCDIGVNLTNNRFNDDLQQVLTAAADACVNRVIITGTSEGESQKALDLATQYPKQCWSTAGVHPHDADNVSTEFVDVLKQIATDEKVVAIGECGLDFNRNFSTPENQKRVFQSQLELALALDKPVFLHERDAFETQLNILNSYQHKLRGVAHCFTGDDKQMQGYLSLGLFIGVTGWICDPKRGGDLREAIKSLPLERLLIETDAPFLTPKQMAKKTRRNEPAFLTYVVDAIAEIKQVEPEIVAQHSWDNAEQLFRLGGASC